MKNVPKLISLAAWVAREVPIPMRSRLSKFFDTIYPSWRTAYGQSRARFSLEWRLLNGRPLSGSPFFHILGPTYLDVTLSPIGDVELRSTEVSNLDALKVEAGGSAIYIGRYLYLLFGKYSSLYTRLGTNDQFRKELKALISKQRWWKHFERTTDPGAQSAASIHLMQRDHTFFTTFTHRGAALSLKWTPYLKLLKRRGKRGGCLIVTGFFRTNLKESLCDSLAQMPPRMLVVLDSGMFRPAEFPVGVREKLLDALGGNLIDIYICTYEELTAVMEAGNCVLPADTRPEAALARYQADGMLPRITVIRHGISHEGAAAYLAVDGCVEKVTVGPDQLPKDVAFNLGRGSQQPGARGALTAGIAHGIAAASRDGEVIAISRHAVEIGLREWLGTCA